jgi:4-hydroxy-3-polyprenylbenzoate decarboxylase
MLALTRMGAVVLPPMPAFYNKPSAVDDIVTHIVCRVLDQFGIENSQARRWQGAAAARTFAV